MKKAGGEIEARKPSAPDGGPQAEIPRTRTRSASPAVTRKKAPRRGSGTTATTNKSNKTSNTNKTYSSNATNRSTSSKTTNKTKSSSASKKKGPPLSHPPLPHPPLPPTAPPRVQPQHPPSSAAAVSNGRRPQQSPGLQGTRPSGLTTNALVPVATNALVVKRSAPPPSPTLLSSSIQGSSTGQRVGMDGRTTSTSSQIAPKPPSFKVANKSLAGPQYMNKRNSHTGFVSQTKPAMRAPQRPNSMVTEGNRPNHTPSNDQPLPPKTKILRGLSQKTNNAVLQKQKTKSLLVKANPGATSAAIVLRQPDPRQPPRAKSLDLEDLAATESDSSGGSGNHSNTAVKNPFQGFFARTKSMMEDLMGSGNSFHDEPTTAIVPVNDSGRGQLSSPAARRGSMKNSRRFSNQGSDHLSLATSSHHRRQNLPPPPNRGTSFVPGLGGSSLHGGSSHSVDFLSSSSTVLSRTIIDEPPFEHDPLWKVFLRYLRLLPPSPKELPINRKIRTYIWVSLVLDLVNAVVAIATFTQVTTCCGKPIWSLGGTADWSTAMTVISYIYIFGIFLEVVPVVRESGIPWNILNPLFGFLLTFAVFFDDSRVEAISMWILESIAVGLDFLVYRLKRQKRMDKEVLLDTINVKLEPFFASNRKASGTKWTAMDMSFHEAAITAMEEETVADHREIKLLRDRRHLRHSLAEDQRHLNYHLGGVVFNTVLIFITLIFIVAIASTGGMCVIPGTAPNPFSQDQLGICSACQGVAGKCEICTATTSQCHYPY